MQSQMCRAADVCVAVTHLAALRRQSPPDMLVVNMQEVGGKHKENLPLMLRKGYVCGSGLRVSVRRRRTVCRCTRA